MRPPETRAELLLRLTEMRRVANAKAAAAAAERAARGEPEKVERTFRHALRGEEARHAVGGNGAPPLDEPERAFLKNGVAEVLRLGVLLYGDRHTTDLSKVVSEDPRQVRRWKTGEGNGPSENAARWLRAEAVERIASLQGAVLALEATYPGIVPRPPEPEVTKAPPVDDFASRQIHLVDWLAQNPA